MRENSKFELRQLIARGNFKLTENRTDDALPANATTPKCCGQTAHCWGRHLLVFCNFFELWDTISWSLRLQRPTIWGFGHKNYHSYQYQQYPHIFVLFLYPLFVFFLVSGNISLLKNILGAFLFYCELKYFWALKKCEIIHWNERMNKGPYAVSFLSIGLTIKP